MAALHAQLSWETRQLDFRPALGEAAVSGDFEFFNSGTVPLTIKDVKSSCGCTTTALAKKTYAPREKGKITATFTIGERQGLQQKQIMVTTDDAAEPYTQLTVRTFIPELVHIEPAAIKWVLNGENGARTLRLTMGAEQAVQVIGVRASDERLFATLKPLEGGRGYEVTVTAASTAQPLRAVVRIETDYPAERPKVFNVPVEISAPFLAPVAAGLAPASANRPTASFPPQQQRAPGTAASPQRPTANPAQQPGASEAGEIPPPPISVSGARTYNPAQQFPRPSAAPAR